MWAIWLLSENTFLVTMSLICYIYFDIKNSESLQQNSIVQFVYSLSRLITDQS